MPIISESVLVTLVVALPAEAGPLKDFFQLKPLRATKAAGRPPRLLPLPFPLPLPLRAIAAAAATAGGAGVE